MTPLLRALLVFLPALLHAAAGQAAPAAGNSAQGAAQAPAILFVSTAPIQPGKFRLLADLAARQGLRLESRFAEKLPTDADGRLFQGYRAVFFDAPRDHLRDFVQARLATALPGLKAPHVWLHEGKPAWAGLPEPLARRLHAYYVNGSRPNFENFFRTLAAHLGGRSLQGIPEPIVFPKSAVYHPKAPGLVFADAAAYLAWKGVDTAGAKRPPVVAIALHQQYIAAEQTAFIDDLIERIEAAGAVALPFYSPVMDPMAVRRLVRVGERNVADALINTQIMLNPEGRRSEFADLGIPVVQAMPYRKGDAADWAADPQGIALMDVPFYLAQAEYAGVTDIQIAAATRKHDDQVVSIPVQASAVVNKALKLVALQRKANAEKKVGVLFWNYPPGEKNLSASYLNLPRSLEATLQALKAAGYRTEEVAEKPLTTLLQRLLAPYYRDGELPGLLRDDLAERLPVAVYKRWLATQPEAVRHSLQERWGEPEKSAMVLRQDGQVWFIVPRLKLGNVVFMPQPPRGEKWEEKEKALYHSTKALPSHFYLAAYLWLRERQGEGEKSGAKSGATGSGFGADALIHYGTHGTQEWLPGKERGLAVSDAPMLAVGDTPVLYPYIVDNIGESLQAKRRGRATIISHQTPPFVPAGLHEALTRLHDTLHAWLAQDEGAVKEKLKADLLAQAKKERIDKDLGWAGSDGEARLQQEFPAFVEQLHDHLHELARTAQPLGLHTFGRAPAEVHRLGTVLLMLGKPFWEAYAAPGEEADETLVGDYRKLSESAPYRLLKRYLVEQPQATPPAALAETVAQARRWYADLGAGNDQAALLQGLAGRYIPTSYGGDPMKNPEALPTGRNLYGFDPSRIPTPQAWAAGKEALEALLAEHRKQTGKQPAKLTFSLWSVETMRHQGILEAQALWALGVEPVWDSGGRVGGVRLVSREALGRPRVDVVLSATGLYRDHFPNAMKQLVEAVRLAAEAEEADNPVAANARRIAADLIKRGVPAEAAKRAGQTRLFSSESGKYGTGLDDAVLATDTWKGKAEGDRKLAQLYLSRMQFGYGPDEAEWGQAGAKDGKGKALAGLNLYAEQLKGTEGAVLSRSSNLYGMLTTDDPFQYLGGIALAVRHLDGKAPQLYISNLRQTGNGGGKVEGAAQFLAKELATRNFHPGYIQGLMQEGYAGTLQVLDSVNNFWGWNATAREVVRDDQWQEFVDVYVRDKHRLGVKDWFEKENPHALAQTIERMLEAARQGYWQADAATVDELKQRYRELAAKHDVRTDNAAFAKFAGYGLQTPAAAPAPTRPQSASQLAEPPPPPETPAPPVIQGMQLEKIENKPLPAIPPLLAASLLLLLAALGGGAWQARREQGRRPLSTSTPSRSL